jgi:hypothetical protein
MNEVTKQLIQKVRLECEEAHRQLVFARLGVAAISLLCEPPLVHDALSQYRAVLDGRAVCEDSEPLVTVVHTDISSLLHAIHNALEAQQMLGSSSSTPLLDPAELQERTERLRSHFSTSAVEAVLSSRERLNQLSVVLESGVVRDRSAAKWCEAASAELARTQRGDILLDQIRQQLESLNAAQSSGSSIKLSNSSSSAPRLEGLRQFSKPQEAIVVSLATRLTSIRVFPMIIQSEWDRIVAARSAAVAALTKLTPRTDAPFSAASSFSLASASSSSSSSMVSSADEFPSASSPASSLSSLPLKPQSSESPSSFSENQGLIDNTETPAPVRFSLASVKNMPSDKVKLEKF